MKGEVMKKKSKTKQQLLLELEELRTRLDAMKWRFQETHETLQAVAHKYAESIVETVPEPLVVLASNLRVISANRSFYETFQVTPRETEGRSLFDIGNRQWDIPSLRELLEEIISKNTQFNDFEVDYVFPAIGRKKMLLNARRVYREGQGTDTILLAIEDMTEHKAMEEALKISETRYRRLFETAQDGILILDAETGQISDVNPFLIEMLDYSREDLLGKKLWEIGAFKDIEASKAAFSELQEKGCVRYDDLPLVTKDGRPMAVEFVSNVYLVNQHKVIQCNIRDITQRKRTEEGLKESEEKYRQLVELAQEGVWAIDAEANITFVNPRMAEMLGYSVEEITGRSLFSFMDELGVEICKSNIERHKQA
jgi:PAS domain S-box-containing protein